MEFLQPLALFGLAAAAVPALLHLLQRRQPPTVVFPAVRYLVEAEQRHSRNVRLRNLLLLLLRTALIAAIALAAARPVVPTPFGGTHAPSAVAVVLDHSLSSGAVVAGEPRLRALQRAAGAVGREAGAGDRLWLVGVDGTPQPIPAADWRAAIEALQPIPRRLDLGAAVRTAAAVIAGQRLPGAVIVLSDLQASALTETGDLAVPVVLLAAEAPPGNRGVGPMRPEPDTWTSGGVVVTDVVGTDTTPVEIRLALGPRTLGRALGGAGGSVALPVDGLAPGWHVARAELTPDELRADDAAAVALRVSPPAAAAVRGAGPFVDAAMTVLVGSGRVRSGRAVALGDRLESGASILLPPADPARVAAANQALAARGVPLRFGPLERGEWRLSSELFTLGAATARQRYRLEGPGDVLATVGGVPWALRAGDVVVLGTRLDDDWTDLPLRPEFVPFLDALLNRVGAGEAWRVNAVPGQPVTLPGSARRLLLPGGALTAPAGAAMEAPADPGVYFVTDAGGDTVGALQVHTDPRESDLRPASPAVTRASLGGARIVDDIPALVTAAFAGRRAELTSLLLALALLLGIVELALGSAGSGRGRG